MDGQFGVMRESVEVARESAKAAQANIEIFINKERARLRVSLQPPSLSLEPYVIAHLVTYEITYYGLTEARIIDSKVQAVATNSVDPPDLGSFLISTMDIPQIITGSTPLKAKTTLLCLRDVGVLHKFTPQEIDDIEQKRMFIHCRGFVAYKDTFGRDRKTSFCYLWVPSDPFEGVRVPVLDKWERSGPPEANEET